MKNLIPYNLFEMAKVDIDNSNIVMFWNLLKNACLNFRSHFDYDYFSNLIHLYELNREECSFNDINIEGIGFLHDSEAVYDSYSKARRLETNIILYSIEYTKKEFNERDKNSWSDYSINIMFGLDIKINRVNSDAAHIIFDFDVKKSVDRYLAPYTKWSEPIHIIVEYNKEFIDIMKMNWTKIFSHYAEILIKKIVKPL